MFRVWGDKAAGDSKKAYEGLGFKGSGCLGFRVMRV